jgi:hypothetical protein
MKWRSTVELRKPRSASDTWGVVLIVLGLVVIAALFAGAFLVDSLIR